MASEFFSNSRFIWLSRIGFCFCVALLLVSDASAQQRQLLFEEIQTIPDDNIGEWVIGGKTFITNRRTFVSDEHPLEVGCVAVVEYVENNDQNQALGIQAFPIKAEDVNDGPYIFWKDKTTAEVVTMVAGKVERKTIEGITKTRFEEGLSKLETSVMLNPEVPQPPKSTWEAPSKLIAISDLEGHYENAIAFLKAHKVIDENRNWIWDEGHLVLVGDLIDRGEQVTELMVFLRRLEHEAQKAGGQIHYVLGNHEVMVMGADIRYIHLKYHFIAQRMGMGYHELFGTNSDIGRWWRSKNVVTKVGNLLFVHAGYSPELDEAKLTPNELNTLVRKGLPPAIPTGITAGDNPIKSQNGPLWYRGYFNRHADMWPKPTNTEIDAIVNRHEVEHIIIGHTVVDKVGPLGDTRHVIAIDVKWADSRKCEGLLQEDGKLWRLTMDGERELIEVQ